MKKILNLAAIAVLFVFTSCNEDDKELIEKKLSGKNSVHIEFDNSFNENDLTFGVYNADKTEAQEKLNITKFNYIVSNFVLIQKDGTEIPYKDGYFIISEGGNDTQKANTKVMLKDIPAGTYTKIKFGIGIDQKRYLQGQDAQKDFWLKAQSYGMTWSWQAGYKFVVLEGKYKNAKNIEDDFSLHIASRGSKVDLYKEVTLNMTDALVDSDKSPQLHIVVDAFKMLNGVNKIILEGDSDVHGGEKAALIAKNNQEMFKVHHVHNGSGNHHK